jgi:superkiller protein 3
MLKIDAPATEYFRVVDVAMELLKSGQYEASIPKWRKAVELGPSEAAAHNNLGVALAETGKIDEAIAHYNRALELSPRYPDAHNNLGEALIVKRRIAEAIAHFEKALEVDPRHAGSHANLGAMLAQQGKAGQAIPHLQKAIEYKPDSASAHRNLGLALAITGKLEDASRVLVQGVKLTDGRDVTMLDLLSRIYAEMGRFTEAVQSARRALAVATQQNDYKAMEALKTRIASYESQKR